jgi:aspartate racemase
LNRPHVKTLGIVGGIGPESTIEYYRFLIAAYRKQNPDGRNPPVIINSIDVNEMLDLFAANQLAKVTEYLAGEVNKLARAGAHLGLLAANTPHIVFAEIQRRSKIPLISIVEATCEAAQALGLKRLGLLGTLFTMQGRFYSDVFSKAGIVLAVPKQEEQAFVHDKYMNELLNGIIRPETRERLLAIVDQLKEREHIEGVILAGTELPLILRDADQDIAFLDTTEIHVKAALAAMLA